MSDGKYLFDVGVVALAHAKTPVSESALSFVKRAISGDIEALVPHTALFGAHNVLTNYYGFSTDEASRLMENFMTARRIEWYDQLPETVVRNGLARAAEHNIEGWDGFYACIALEEDVNTILTLDDDFESIEGVTAEVILSPEEFARLNDYLEA